jgi:endonuclease YncB( thermonuclease family)
MRAVALFLSCLAGIALGSMLANQSPVEGQPAPVARAFEFPPLGKAYVLPTRAIDGDTFAGFWLVEIRTFRIDEMNAPEMHGDTREAGVASQKNLDKILPRVPIPIENKGFEKYGRHLVIAYQPDGTTKLSKQQIDGGFGKFWDGRGPRP